MISYNSQYTFYIQIPSKSSVSIVTLKNASYPDPERMDDHLPGKSVNASTGQRYASYRHA